MRKIVVALVLVVSVAACGKDAAPTGGAPTGGAPAGRGATEEYALKAKATEAALQLNKLGKLAKVAYVEQAAFPVGTAALTPATKCCDGPDHKCAVTDAWTTDAAWKELDFQIDEPAYFQYSYTGTATSFTATAVGDLDCDGTSITYTMTGTSEGGTPKVELTKPDQLD